MKASPIRAWIVPALLSFVLVFCAARRARTRERTRIRSREALVPKPAFSPGDVIRIQLEALRHNDEQDRGIAVAFLFASPTNRANTGPLPRFIGMIKEGPYALMLDFREAIYGPMETISDRARQRVTLTGVRASITYWFYLSRQSEPPYVDCWMTDAVYIDPSGGQVV